MNGKDKLSPVRVAERLQGSALVSMFFAKSRVRPKPTPVPVPAPPGDDVFRRRAGSVELILSYAGASRRNFCRDAAVALVRSLFWLIFPAALSFPIMAAVWASAGYVSAVSLLVWGTVGLLIFVALTLQEWPRILRISFAPATGPMKVRVVRWWWTRRIKVSALSAITIVEYRYRARYENAGGDTQRETISRLPYRIDAILHRADGGSRIVRGEGHRGWRPDPRGMYGPLGDLLAPVGLTIDRQVKWTREPTARRSRYFSPGSGGANGLGGGF